MFQQLLTPVSGSLGLSFVVAILPILTVLIMLGVLRRPAWQASLAGLIVGLVIAVGVWSLPVGLALNAVFNGIVFALWPVMWIVVNALLLYNIAVRSGRFEVVPGLADRQSAQRSPRHPGGHRLLLRRSSGRRGGIRHAGRHHQLRC